MMQQLYSDNMSNVTFTVRSDKDELNRRRFAMHWLDKETGKRVSREYHADIRIYLDKHELLITSWPSIKYEPRTLKAVSVNG